MDELTQRDPLAQLHPKEEAVPTELGTVEQSAQVPFHRKKFWFESHRQIPKLASQTKPGRHTQAPFNTMPFEPWRVAQFTQSPLAVTEVGLTAQLQVLVLGFQVYPGRQEQALGVAGRRVLAIFWQLKQVPSLLVNSPWK